MIPNLALMISAYIGFRMIEGFLFPTERYLHGGAKIAACVFAAIALFVTGVSLLEIMTAGSNVGPLPR